MKISFLFSVLLFSSYFSFSQKEGNNWYFGEYAGVTFNYGKPVSLKDSRMLPRICSATISNNKGRLLFYSNGIQVWDSTHYKLNSSVDGAKYNFQGVIFIPHPNSDSSNLNYLFATSGPDGETNKKGFSYSVIDSKLRSGKGELLTNRLNVLLFYPSCNRLSAVKHANRKDFWVVTYKFKTDTVYAYHITKNGVNFNPILSKTDIVYTFSYGQQGVLKFSPDGSKICSIYYPDSSFVADFNPATGKVSNIIKLPYFRSGCEFSSSSRFLYIRGFSVNGKDNLYQFDVSKMEKNSIISSKILIDSNFYNSGNGVMQLGPDGKIYIPESDYRYLHVIHAPDSVGKKCRIQKDYVDLGVDRKAYGNLPDMIQSFYRKNTFDVRQSCSRDTVFFAVSDTFYLDSAKWNFGDTASGSLNYSKLTSGVFHIYKKAGFYTAKLISFHKEYSDTIFETFYINTRQPYLGRDTAMCKGKKITLVPPPNYTSYVWNGSYKVKNLTVTQAGTYRLTTVDYDGCVSSDTIIVKNAEVKAAFTLSDSVSCLKGNKFELKDKSTFTNDTYSKTLWNYGDSTFSADSSTVKSYANSGVYKVKMFTYSKLGCIDSAEKEITVFAQNNIGFAVNDSIQCLNKNSFDFINTSPDTANITSFWDLGEQTLYAKTNIIGKFYSKDSTYLVKLFTQTNNGCKDTLEKQITVLPAPQADFSTGITCSKTKTDFIFTGKKLANTTFEWNFDNESKAYSENASYMFSNAGNKKVKLIVKADNNCNDTIEKTIEIKKQAKAEFETKDVCENDSAVFINKSKDADEFLWKFGDGQYSKLKETRHKYQIPKTTTFLVTLVAKSGCSDSVTNPITVNQNPNSDFTSTQNGDKLTLKAQSGYSNYKWKFNNKDSISVITENYIHTLNNYTPIKICLQITDINNCTSQTCKTIPLGTNQTFKPQTFKLYPNPNSGTFTIESETAADLEIQIFDVLGREISFTKQPNIQTSNIQTIKLTASETRGMYFVKLRQNGVIWVERVVVGE